MPHSKRPTTNQISPFYKKGQRRTSTLLQVQSASTTPSILVSNRPSNLAFDGDFSSLDEPDKAPAEDFKQDANTLTNYKNFEEFLLHEIDAANKDSEAIIESSNLSRSFMETMRLDSKIHGNLSSFRSGGAAPLRTDPTKTAKSMKIKSKSYSSPTDKLPLLGGVIPAHKIFNRLTLDRKTDQNALQDKDANGEKVQLTKTPVELLRYIKEGDIEIENIDNDTNPPRLILKYKEGHGSKEFNGRFILELNPNGQERIQNYDQDYGYKLDPLKKLDQENMKDISQMITTNSPLMRDHPNELQLVTEFFTNYPDTEMSIFYTTEQYIATQEILKLEVLASNGKAITTDVDIATRSIPLDLKLPTHLEKHLYEPINMSEPGRVKKIQNKRKLLKYTMELFEHFKQNYYQKMTELEQEITKTQKQAEETVSPEESTALQEKLKTLELQHKMLSESPIGKLMVQEQAQASQTKDGSTLSKIRQIFSKTQQPKLNFSDLFLDGEDAKKHFTELAGIVTPFEFLQNILNNCIAKTDALQHGADIRTPADPENAEQIMFFKGTIFRTIDDQQRMKLYLAKDFFEQQFIPVNPRADMKVWGELVAKQLASRLHKARISKDTKLAYFNHLMTTLNSEELLIFIKKLPRYQLLDIEQKKEFLEYVKQKTEENGDIAILIHQAIQKAKLELPSSEDPRQQTGFFRNIGTILTNLQQKWQPNTESSNPSNIEGITSLQSPNSRAQKLDQMEQTYSPTNSSGQQRRKSS